MITYLKLESYKLVIHTLMAGLLVSNNSKKRAISLQYICAESACNSVLLLTYVCLGKYSTLYLPTWRTK